MRDGWVVFRFLQFSSVNIYFIFNKIDYNENLKHFSGSSQSFRMFSDVKP